MECSTYSLPKKQTFNNKKNKWRSFFLYSKKMTWKYLEHSQICLVFAILWLQYTKYKIIQSFSRHFTNFEVFIIFFLQINIKLYWVKKSRNTNLIFWLIVFL